MKFASQYQKCEPVGWTSVFCSFHCLSLQDWLRWQWRMCFLIVIYFETCHSSKTLLNLASVTSSSLLPRRSRVAFSVTMESHYWCERTTGQHLLPFPTPLRYLGFLLSVFLSAIALWCCCWSVMLLAAGSAGFLRTTLRWSMASYWLPEENCVPDLFCSRLIFFS